MAEMEIKTRRRLTRREAGERLIALGQALAAGPVAEWEVGEDSVRFTVADEVAWEFELEVDGDERELEIELKWTQAAAEPAPSRPRRATRRRS